MWSLLGLGAGEDGGGARFWSNQCIWVHDGGGAGDTALWPFLLPENGCGQCVAGSALGLCWVVGGSFYCSYWEVWAVASRLEMAGGDGTNFIRFGLPGFAMAEGRAGESTCWYYLSSMAE